MTYYQNPNNGRRPMTQQEMQLQLAQQRQQMQQPTQQQPWYPQQQFMQHPIGHQQTQQPMAQQPTQQQPWYPQQQFMQQPIGHQQTQQLMQQQQVLQQPVYQQPQMPQQHQHHGVGFGTPQRTNEQAMTGGPLQRTARRRTNTVTQKHNQHQQFEPTQVQQPEPVVDDSPTMLVEPGITVIPVGGELIYKGESVMSGSSKQEMEHTDEPTVPASGLRGDFTYAGMKKLSVDNDNACTFQTITAEYVFYSEIRKDLGNLDSDSSIKDILSYIRNGIEVGSEACKFLDYEMTKYINTWLTSFDMSIDSMANDFEDLNEVLKEDYESKYEDIEVVIKETISILTQVKIYIGDDGLEYLTIKETYMVIPENTILSKIKSTGKYFVTIDVAPTIVTTAAEASNGDSLVYILAPNGKYLMASCPISDKIWVGI